jgi:hypothetical protein
MATDIQRAYETIKAKATLYDGYFHYYDGDAPLKYSTERLRLAFEALDVYFSENWLSVIVGAVLDRLTLKGFTVEGNATAETELEALFIAQQLALTAYDVHEGGLVTSEAFVIVERDEEGTVAAYYNDPRLAHVFYKADAPKVKDFAAKMWYDESAERWHIAIYYPDRTDFWSAKKTATTYKAFTRYDSQPNPSGRLPVFHFRNTRRGRGEYSRSEISIQDAISKLFSDMMVAAEFTSLKQRVFIGKADPGNMKTFEDLWYPDPEGKVQEVGGAELDNFLDAMTKLANDLAIISKTPKHYFFNQGGDPSGDALSTMEAPLIRKVSQRQENYGVTWQELAAYLLELQGVTVDPTAITPVWAPAQTIQPTAAAQILQTEVSSGVPLKVAAERQGWSKEDLDKLPEQDPNEVDNGSGGGADKSKERDGSK